MSSHTEPAALSRENARRAVRWSSSSQYLSWIAGLIGLGFVVAFLIQAGLFAALMPGDAPPPVVIENPDQITSYESTITGVDRQNQPYEVKAAKGAQDKDRPELIHLETVAAKFRKLTGESYDVTAAAAHYDTKIKELDLEGNVVIRQIGKFIARMDKAHVVVEAKKLTSGVPVAVDMADGTIAAGGLQISDDGDDILFLNGVKARFGIAAAKGDGVQ